MLLPKRFLLVLTLGLSGALYFWLASRYPNLHAKAMMAHSANVADTLSVWPLFEVRPEYPFWQKVALSTLNWCNDNWRGMSFGVFLGAIFLTLLSYLKLPAASSRLTNTFFGVLLGTPLGVCVNCAAPIFKGILQARRVEMAFAAMLSSPTMNVVVLTMIFSLFPFYMAVAKVAFTLLAIFVGIPLLSRWLGPDSVRDLDRLDVEKLIPDPSACPAPGASESWRQAIGATAHDLGKRLWYMARKTVPLMFLAGLIGALLSHAIPLDSLSSAGGSALSVFIAAAIGVCLPTPMAFDVILVHAFYSHGLPANIAVTLLCTLGIYSIYSFFIVWASASRQWALSLFAWVFITGSAFGLATGVLHQKLYVDRNVASFQSLKQSSVEESPWLTQDSKTLVASDAPRAAPVAFKLVREDGPTRLSRAALAKRTTRDGPPFIKREGPELGLVRGFRYGIRDYPDPFWLGRGTAAGDYDNDGWTDLVFGTNHGFALYKNRGGWFELQEQPNPALSQYIVYAVAFVDLNNDGWLDLFFSTFNQGNFVLLNHEGKLDFFHPIRVPNNNGILTVSPAFGDLDGDGYLDILNGNMALGIITGMNVFGPRRESSIVYNHAMQFREVPLPGYSGETMASLISDLNGDGIPDIAVSHDFVVPDNILLGTRDGSFRNLGAADGFVPKTPVFSMSIDTGDLNNDLRLDLVMAGTIERKSSIGSKPIDGWEPKKYAEEKWGKEFCESIRDPIVRKNCLVNREADYLVDFEEGRKIEVNDCRRLSQPVAQQACLLSTMWLLVTHDDFRPACGTFSFDRLLSEVCEILHDKGRPYVPADFPGAIPQEDDSFVFLSGQDGRFHDINEKKKKRAFDHPGGWTWNMRIADLDNDGWQDIFNSEGTVRKNDYGFNVFMKNKGGKEFEQKQFSSNLVDNFGLYSFVYIDTRNDGYLDVIGNSAEGPVQIYQNNFSAPNHRLAVSLRDGRGNRFGIGAKVYVHYDHHRKALLRELKAGGGYLSFDAPVAYFGLGTAGEIDELRVKWRDGAETVLKGPFPADYHYRIERRN